MYSKRELVAFGYSGKNYAMILPKNQSFHINNLSVIQILKWSFTVVNTFGEFPQGKMPKFKILKARFLVKKVIIYLLDALKCSSKTCFSQQGQGFEVTI